MKEQIIQLEPHDDIDSVRDKLSWARAPRVLLVFPRGGQRILASRLDLVLLQREATRRRIDLALSTGDPLVIENARDLGIATFRTVEDSHKTFWRTAQAQLKLPEERPTPLDPELVEAGTRLRPADDTLPEGLRRALTTTVFSLTVLILAGLAVMLLPGATVTLSPATDQVTVSTTIIADPNISVEDMDVATGLIPARMVGVEVEGSTSVETTGTLLMPSQKARGVVLFTNRIPDQVNIPAGTVVRTSAARPVRFVTLADVTLPGQIGETVEAPAEAIEAGFEGNVPAGRINQVEGPLSSRVAVVNPEPTQGGLADEVRAVSADDMERARALLRQQLQQRAFAEMETRLLEDFEFVPLESLNVVLVYSETFSAYEGQAAERLNLAMRVVVQGVAIDERLARQVVYDRLADKVGSGFQIGADSLVFRQGEVIGIDDERRVTFIMQGAGDVHTAINAADVQQLVRARRLSEAASRLENRFLLTAPPRIDVSPGFWPWMPVLPMRITVEVEG